ncbi:MAG: hypothetical protein AB7L09_03360 [Nitrospira sp.]
MRRRFNLLEADDRIRSAGRAGAAGDSDAVVQHAVMRRRIGEHPDEIMRPHIEAYRQTQKAYGDAEAKWRHDRHQRGLSLWQGPNLEHPSNAHLKQLHDAHSQAQQRAHDVAHAIGHHAGMSLPRPAGTPGVSDWATSGVHLQNIAVLHHASPGHHGHRAARFPSHEHAVSFMHAARHHYPGIVMHHNPNTNTVNWARL